MKNILTLLEGEGSSGKAPKGGRVPVLSHLGLKWDWAGVRGCQTEGASLARVGSKKAWGLCWGCRKCGLCRAQATWRCWEAERARRGEAGAGSQGSHMPFLWNLSHSWRAGKPLIEFKLEKGIAIFMHLKRSFPSLWFRMEQV